MIYTDIIQRTLLIKSGAKQGSGYAYSYDGKAFLITAKHVVENNAADRLSIFHQEMWKDVEVAFRFAPEDQDLAVGLLEIPSGDESTAQLRLGGIVMGQDVFAVGYPLHLYQWGGEISKGFPLPFVSKGCFSAMDVQPGARAKGFFVSGQIDEGYSGGPIACAALKDQPSQILGIVSHNLRRKNQYELKDGQQFVVAQPSNLIYAVSSVTALEIIEHWQ